MHSIDKWYYTNLNARPDKMDAQELAAAIQGMPKGVLTRFPAAMENEDLPDNKAELCGLMIADGFFEWEYELVKDYKCSISLLAADWSKLRVLRHVVESGENAVITTDNAYLIEKFSKVQEVVGSLPPDANALYLHWSSELDAPGHVEAMSRLEPSGVPGILKNFGLGGWIIYFTNKGARYFLDLWREIPDCDGQDVVYYAAKRYPNLEGFYACNPQVAQSIFGIGDMRTLSNCTSPGNRLTIKDKTEGDIQEVLDATKNDGQGVGRRESGS